MIIEAPLVTDGSIEVIAGCMFSGKTTLLIHKLMQYKYAGKRIAAIKPSIDTRYQNTILVTHNHQTLDAFVVSKASEIVELALHIDVLGIDEAQFLDQELPDVVTHIANQGKLVIIAGLDLDAQGQPFGPMPYLLALAEHVVKLKAICTITGAPASFTYRKTADSNQIVIGAQDIYEARSRKAFYNL